jgi:ABC-type Na+ efflux pump permease subunit
MNKFNGWKTVFGFTFQRSGGKAFKFITALIALLIVGILILVNVLVAKPEEKEKASRIKQVYVLDESGLQPNDFGPYMEQVAKVKFGDTTFENMKGQTKEDALQAVDQKTTTGVLVVITTTDKGYQLEGLLPSKSVITEGEVSTLLNKMKLGFESSKLQQAGLSNDQLVTIMTPVQASYQSVGEDTSEAVMVIKIVVPMFFGLVMYMMLMFHGQTVSKSVSTEKTSKLMETLLTSIHPYALITGKVLAISSLAMIQFIVWVIAAVGGLYGGNAIAHSMYPNYENIVVTIINFLRDNIGESALTLESVILAVAIFCVGFLFYCVLAGLAGCMVSKPEDVASAQGIFIFPILISWLVCYIAAAAENTALLTVARFIPFTIPFGAPVDLLSGTISLGEGILSFVVLLAFSLIFIMLSARLYKGLVLYNGQKMSLKKIGQVIRAKD